MVCMRLNRFVQTFVDLSAAYSGFMKAFPLAGPNSPSLASLDWEQDVFSVCLEKAAEEEEEDEYEDDKEAI